MGYAVLHLDKASGNEAKMTAHIERTQMPKNAAPERTHLNEELINFPEGVKSRTEAIQHRLDNAGLTRKIGTNQVRVIRVMLTGSHEDMKRIVAEGRLRKWCADNIKWLHDTFGRENLVSAVLHLDESTPHIHASIVPIIRGERRKAKEKNEETGKKYRKKNPDAVRLCADDIMTRIKLKEYQDTYAEKMNKYGLERGIVGSEARHITTQEFYRNAIAMQGDAQDNIEELLRIEESKRQAVEGLTQKEQEARTRTEQAAAKKQQAEAELAGKQLELQKVKGELKIEKFKSTVAEAGSAIMSGISSALGTSKVKRQQQEIDELKSEKAVFQMEIKTLKEQMQAAEKEHEKITDKLRQELKKIHDLFPHIRELLRIENLCRALNFGESIIKSLLQFKPVSFKGDVYSPEYKRHFNTENSIAKVEEDTKEANKFQLTIDNLDSTHWFRQKQQEFLQSVDIKQPKQERKQGLRM